MASPLLSFLAAILLLYYSADVTSSGNYIENNHYLVNDGSRAFDNLGSAWYTAETGAGVDEVSWIGQDFGVYSREIRRVGLMQYGSNSYDVTSYQLQYSDDAAEWTGCGVAALSHTNTEQYANFDPCGSHRYWRVLANSGTGSAYWYVVEIEMFEYISDDTPTASYIYVSTLPSGNEYSYQRSTTFGDGVIVLVIGLLCVISIIGIVIQVINARPKQ